MDIVATEVVGGRTWYIFGCRCGARIRRVTRRYRGETCFDCYRRDPKRRAAGLSRFQPGERYDMLVVVKRAKGRRILVQCDCGSAPKFVASTNLHSGLTGSCGCRRGAPRTHGASRTAEYRTWASMKSRCTRPSTTGYRYYGGRGIRVCRRWLQSFEAFREDMGERPEGFSIDRKNNDGHYSCGKCEECAANGWPANCRWATQVEQVNNQRVSSDAVFLEYNGERLQAADWARRLGVTRQAIEQRMRSGWTAERICTTGRPGYAKKMVGRRRNPRVVAYAGLELTVAQWAKRLGVPAKRIRNRLDAGKDPHEALSPGRLPKPRLTAEQIARGREVLEKARVARKGRAARRSHWLERIREAASARRGTRVQHRPHRCAVCGEVGHNRATCAKRSKAA